MDLYADEWQTFRRITLPLVAPGIVAGALLAFSLSFDDFIITNFNSGDGQHLPEVRLRVVAARHPGAGQRDRVGHVLPRPDRRADRPGRRAAGGSQRPRHRADLRTPTGGRRPRRRAAHCRTGWTAPAPDPCPALAGRTTADLAVVGGGYTGLWTALLAKERDPGRDVVLLEARTVGWAASGSQRRVLLGQPDPRAAQRAGPVPGRDGDSRAARPGEPRRHRGGGGASTASTAPSSAPASSPSRPRPGRSTSCARCRRSAAQVGGRAGVARRRRRCARKVDSPTYLGGVLDRDGVAMVDPARLARGLRAACLRLGRPDPREHPRRAGSTTTGRRRRAADAVRRG